MKSPTWKALISSITNKKSKCKGRSVVCHILPAFKDLTKLEVLRRNFVT